MRADILSWSRSQGLLPGSLRKGPRYARTWITTPLYGKKLENRDIVTKAVRPPKAAAKLLELLDRHSAKEDTD